MNRSLLVRASAVGLVFGLACFTACSAPEGEIGGGGPETGAAVTEGAPDTGSSSSSTEGRMPEVAATADAEHVQAAKALLDELGPSARYTLLPGNVMTEIVIRDGSALSPEAITLFGKLTDLKSLQIFNFRSLNDEMAAQLAGLTNLTTLALTNSAISDPTVEMIAASFAELKNLDLSYNANMTNGALKIISGIDQLERLTLVQNRFNDLGTVHLSKLANLRVLDLRGNMEAGDLTMEVVGGLPKLVALKHRSTTVSDYGVESLSQSDTLSSLLMQDFNITNQSGGYLAQLNNLTQLEVFRCQGFGSEGVLALAPVKLERLTLRDLPMVDDRGMAVFTELGVLKRLYLHELASVSDYGLQSLGSLQSLELLDIWSVPQMTDATVDIIASLPNLKTLSIRETGVTDAAVPKLLAMPNLQSLTFKDNGMVTAEGLEKLSTRKWANLDTGSAGGP